MIASGYRKCYSSLGISLKLARELSKIMDDERVIGITLGSLMLVYLLARLATELRPRTASPVYGWFTEGYDTRDLKDAKALLKSLPM